MALPRPISLYASEPIGVTIFENGVLTDPDNQIVTLSIENTQSNLIILPVGTTATRENVGTYAYQLLPENTSVEGPYTVTWAWTMNGTARFITDEYQVTPQMNYWNNLLLNERQAVVDVYGRVENSWDSSNGGPYLAELTQSSFNAYEVIARLFQTEAITYFNFEFQPPFDPPYAVGMGATNTVPTPWYGLIEWGIYTALLRHISRSYIEEPNPQNINVPRLDRRDYRDRWRQEWQDEKLMYDKALRQFKRTQLVGSHRSMLVAGGIIPRMLIQPTRPSYIYASSMTNGGGF